MPGFEILSAVDLRAARRRELHVDDGARPVDSNLELEGHEVRPAPPGKVGEVDEVVGVPQRPAGGRAIRSELPVTLGWRRLNSLQTR